MSERFFVDTNVLVYVYDSGHAAKQTVAAEWLMRLWRERSGRTSTQVLNELYVTLTRKLARGLRADEAWDIVQSLMAWEPQPIDRDLLLRGREIERRYRIGWWDSLIVSAAQLQDCNVLLTEDLQPGMTFGPVTVLNPFNTGIREAQIAYAPILAMPSRHRPRGRPRKHAQPLA